MIPLRSTRVALAAVLWLAGCHCANSDLVELETESSTSAAEDVLTDSSGSTSTTGEIFDASRWIGRYHFENPFLPFGERGDPQGTYSLVNFEILPDSSAFMVYDDCYYVDEPIEIAYEWSAAEDGWMSLRPGPGEGSLRFLSDPEVATLRIQLHEPCRQVTFEVDGVVNTAFRFYPGESCWIDRCTTPNIMQVDYCEGEEPPPCP